MGRTLDFVGQSDRVIFKGNRAFSVRRRQERPVQLLFAGQQVKKGRALLRSFVMPAKAGIQYSKTMEIESRSRSVLVEWI